jgi:glycine hydroxymethyltransferase
MRVRRTVFFLFVFFRGSRTNQLMMRRCLPLLAPPTTLLGNRSLKEADPDMHALLQQERRRQIEGLELIASENFTSRAVLECLGSVATNKYAEGLPGARYYAGAEVIDGIENLCRQRALAAFRLDPAEWGVNVQPYSGSPANFAVYTALLNPHDRIMGLDLPCGGHLTHGFYTAKKKVSASSVYFESLAYKSGKDGRVDHDDLDESARRFRPKLIIAGGSAYPREWEYPKFRALCDELGSHFMVDMAHYSGLVAAGEHVSPFAFADVVTTTTHKTLCGPRSGMIFFRKTDRQTGLKSGLEDRINQAVFPALQGGPHEHQIAAVATQLKEVATPEFVAYIKQVKKNAAALADELVKLGYTLVTGGTDNHLMLVDLHPQGITGSKAEKVLDVAHVTVNKNSVPGDKSAITPGGLRLGSPALTTRGMDDADFRAIAGFIDRGVKIGVAAQKPKQKLVEFSADITGNADAAALGAEVLEFSRKFPFPGFEDPFPCK